MNMHKSGKLLFVMIWMKLIYDIDGWGEGGG